MSHKIFEDKVFPRHVSDLMNLMHMVVFNGTDGEEKWDSYLSMTQKEYVALGLAEYYQCELCIKHHLKAVARLTDLGKTSLEKNVRSMILFLRIDTRQISDTEKEHWVEAWQRFARKIAEVTDDPAMPSLMGLAIGIARNDDFLIDYCGEQVKSTLSEQDIDPQAAVGELEAVVIFMKAASSKNRVVHKVGKLFE